MKKAFLILLAIFIAAIIMLTITACAKQPAQAPKEQPGATKEKSKKESKSASGKKACDVFSAEEAGKVMGRKLVESDNNPNIVPGGAKASYCGFSENDKFALSVSLLEFPDDGRSQEYFDEARKIAKESSDVETVEGLGDDAFWSDPGLWVLVGGTSLSIQIGMSEEGKLGKAKAAAEIIVPRL